MNSVKTSVTWRFIVATADDADDTPDTRRRKLDEHLDAVMDALVDLTACNTRVYDPGITVNLATGEVEFELLVDGSEATALPLGQSVLRSAIHAADGYTPNWDGSPASAEAVEYSDLKVNLEPTPA